MGIVLLLVFLLVPLVEIAVFIEVGGWIGLWPTLGLVILTAFVGTWQLRAQGLATMASARQQLNHGRLPAQELFDAACLLVAGALLLTPGFVTDAAGLALFVPVVRSLLREAAGRYIRKHAETRVFVDGKEVHPGAAGEVVIDAEFQEVQETRPVPKPSDPEDPRRGGIS